MIRFTCPTCQSLLQVPRDAAGKMARCPKCRSHHRVPAPPPADEVLPPARTEEVKPTGLQPPVMHGPFVATFVSYNGVPVGRDLRLRFACAVDPELQHLPWLAGEGMRNVYFAAKSADHPYGHLARGVINQNTTAPPVRLPDVFSPNAEIWLFSGLLSVDDLPDDARPTGSGNRWTIPEDLYCSEVEFAGETTGRVTFGRRPAATVIERQRQRIRAVKRNGGVRVKAVLVQANSALFRPGVDNAPAVVVYSPDPTVAVARLRGLSGLIMDLKGKNQTDPDLAVLSEFVTNETSYPYRRRRLAKRLTAGAEVYIAALDIYREFLPDGVLRGRDPLLCIAEPGSRGGAIELLEENRR